MMDTSQLFFFFSSRRRHTRLQGDWSSDVCSSDLNELVETSGVSASAKGGRIAVACGSRALPQVLRARNALSAATRKARRDRKSGVEGKRGDLGGRRIIKKKKKRRRSGSDVL